MECAVSTYRFRQQVPPKIRETSTRLYDVTFQKTLDGYYRWNLISHNAIRCRMPATVNVDLFEAFIYIASFVFFRHNQKPIAKILVKIIC